MRDRSTLLPSLCLFVLVAAAAPPRASADEADTTDVGGAVRADLCAPFLSVGGGAGAVLGNSPITPAFVARAGVNAGFYVPMLYVMGSVDVFVRPALPFMLDGSVSLGAAIPVPVLHPMVGFKIGGGAHWSPYGWGPNLVFGPQLGWLLRKLGHRVGIRAMVEPLIHYFPVSHLTVPEVTLTVSLVL